MKYILLPIVVILLACGKPRNDSILDRKVPELSGQPNGIFFDLVAALDIPGGVEEYSDDPAFKWKDRSMVGSLNEHQTFKNYSARQILERIISSNYTWTFAEGVLTVQPRQACPYDPLERRIKHFSVKGKATKEAVAMALKQVDIDYWWRGREMVGGGKHPEHLFGTVTVELNNVTAREALNKMAAADGKVAWWVLHQKDGAGNESPLVSLFSHGPTITVPALTMPKEKRLRIPVKRSKT